MSETADIEIEIRPVKKIVIFETLKLSIDELLKRVRLLAGTGQLVPLQWAEGILFLASPFHPECDVIVEEAMRGSMYLGTVMFAEMPKYEPTRKVGGIEIPVMDQSPSPVFRQVAQWLKEGSWVVGYECWEDAVVSHSC